MLSAQQQQHSSTSCPPEQHMQAALQLPRPGLCTSWSKTHCGCCPWSPCVSLGCLQAVSCRPSGLSAPRPIRGTRQPCSIFRLWRIPLGSPFQSDKVSHCEGEAKTHIRPTDPALTRTSASPGREVAAGAPGEAAKRTAPSSKTQCCALLLELEPHHLATGCSVVSVSQTRVLVPKMLFPSACRWS